MYACASSSFFILSVLLFRTFTNAEFIGAEEFRVHTFLLVYRVQESGPALFSDIMTCSSYFFSNFTPSAFCVSAGKPVGSSNKLYNLSQWV